MYYAVERKKRFVKHHGILGMKWGRKNGPPYPLGSSDHSASEKKAGWKKSLEKSKRVSSFLDGSYKEDSYKRQDAENAEWVKKQADLEKRRKTGNVSVSNKMANKLKNIEDKYQEERIKEHDSRVKEIFSDKELKSDLDEAKKFWMISTMLTILTKIFGISMLNLPQILVKRL